ncbi:MAG: glycosyltransferase family 2 protein [candidate division WOR-3 bacterium]
MRLSVVVPVFNEEENLENLYTRLSAVLEGITHEHEIILVDDGSRDGSWAKIISLHERDKRVRGIRFSRNFGHHIAITAGLDAARGELIAMMDADLQDSPEELPKLIQKINEGYYLVYGIRKSRQDPFFKRVAGALFWKWINRVGGVSMPENQTMLRVMRKEVADALREMRESHRFIHGLMAWTGFPWTSVEVEHSQRAAGRTKYSLRKMISLAINAVTSFSVLPLRLSTYLGLGVAFLSLLLGLYIILRKIFGGYAVLGYASMMAAMLFLEGVVLTVLGIMGEYLGKLYAEALRRPIYILMDKTDD